MQGFQNRFISDLRISDERVAMIVEGHSIQRSGLLLCGILEDGVEKVKMSTGSPNDVIAGFSEVVNLNQTADSKIERLTVPTSAPFTLQLSRTPVLGFGPSSYDVRVSSSTGRPFRQHLSISAGVFSSTERGFLTFSKEEAGTVIDIAYRHQLSSKEAIDLNAMNQTSSNLVVGKFEDRVMVLGGHRIIMTREFDHNADFSTGALRAAADGQITTTGPGVDLTSIMRVTRLPDGSEGMLGLAIGMIV